MYKTICHTTQEPRYFLQKNGMVISNQSNAQIDTQRNYVNGQALILEYNRRIKWSNLLLILDTSTQSNSIWTSSTNYRGIVKHNPRIWICLLHQSEHGISLSLPVNKENKMLFMIVLAESMCKCTVLAIYPCPSSEIFQSCMVFILIQDCNWWPKPYLDNIFSGKGKDFDKHLDVWNKIFTIMEIHRMQVNLAKS